MPLSSDVLWRCCKSGVHGQRQQGGGESGERGEMLYCRAGTDAATDANEVGQFAEDDKETDSQRGSKC